MARIFRVRRGKAAPPGAGEGAAHPDLALAELAGRQHGVVTRRQLLQAGLTSDAIQHRLAVRRLTRAHAGVYFVGHRLVAPGSYLAAVLACGDRAVLSHRSAAALWGLRPDAAGRIDVTIPRGGSRHRAGIIIHTTRSLDETEVSTCEGIRCTSLARTLVDLAGTVTPRALDRALERSLILRLFDLREIDAALARATGRRGTTTLRRLLTGLADEPAPTRNELERRFLDLVRDTGLPLPVVNALVAGYEVDFHWPALRLIVETDGRATHDTPYGFERDRTRDLDLELAGWHVVRVTWRQVIDQPARVAALLRARALP